MRRNYLIDKKFQLKYTITIAGMLLLVMFISGLGLYLGMWGSIIENFSSFKVSQDLENASRIAGYESARYQKGDYRIAKIYREAELLSEGQKDALENALARVNSSLLPKVALLFICIFLIGIFISHKIAGPIYRIEKSASAIKDGDLKVNFNIRKGDELKTAASALEDMVERLHDDIKALKASSMMLDERLAAMKGRLSKEDSERLASIAKEMDKVLSRYKT